jgi:hypothetical protein
MTQNRFLASVSLLQVQLLPLHQTIRSLFLNGMENPFPSSRHEEM